MEKKSDWTKEKFIMLLSHPEMSDSDAAELIGTHSQESIKELRSEVHNFHTGEDTPVLSKTMKELLGSKETLVTCPICKVAF